MTKNRLAGVPARQLSNVKGGCVKIRFCSPPLKINRLRMRYFSSGLFFCFFWDIRFSWSKNWTVMQNTR